MIDTRSFSREAKELMRLCPVSEHSGEPTGTDISTVIAEHPELVSGLSQYVSWVREVGMAIAETTTTPAIGHPVAKTVRKVQAHASDGDKPKSEPRT